MQRIITFVPNILAIIMSIVFIDSLRFKFTNKPETIQIFQNLLDGWAATWGAKGLFAQTGLFRQYAIGSAEIVASALLLLGIFKAFHHLQALGALLAVAIMTGAVSFHLFTPLSTDPNRDGGGLFVVACFNLVAGILLITVFRRKEALAFAERLGKAFGPQAAM